MAQNNSLKLKNKDKNTHNKNTNKRKNMPVEQKDRDRLEVVRNLKKQIQKSQKKVYNGIERTLVKTAKSKREHFELL